MSGQTYNLGTRPARLGRIALVSMLSIAAAQASSIYVSNTSTGLVSEYDTTTGAFEQNIGTFVEPAGLTISGNNLFVADYAAGAIYKVSLTTGIESTFATVPTNGLPFQVAFDPSGNAYVSTLSGFVYKYNSSGTQLGSLAVPSAGGIAYDAVDGNLYVTSDQYTSGQGPADTIEQISTGLKVLNSSFITSNLSDPQFILPDQFGNFAVSNFASGVISGYAPTGAFFGNIASGLQGPGEMAAPGVGYAIDATNYYTGTVDFCAGSGAPCTVLVSQAGTAGTLGLAVGPQFVPEPATAGLLGAGLLVGLALTRVAKRARR